MPSRQMWLRLLNPADRETYRRWARVVAVSYVTMAACGMAVATMTARHQGDVVALHAPTKAPSKAPSKAH